MDSQAINLNMNSVGAQTGDLLVSEMFVFEIVLQWIVRAITFSLGIFSLVFDFIPHHLFLSL